MIKARKRVSNLIDFTNLRKFNYFQITWLMAPVFIWFSYHPIITLGKNATMNLELSLTLIYLLALGLVSAISIAKKISVNNYKNLLKNKLILSLGVFNLLCQLSLIWSVNFLRGVLTSGIIFIISLVIVGAILNKSEIRRVVPAIVNLLFLSAILMSLIAILEVVLGSTKAGLLCAGCTADKFGFVRPNVFTIEPQFFANTLLLPSILAIYKFLSEKDKKQFVIYGSLVFLFSFVIYLSLSRGAIYAFLSGSFLVILLTTSKTKRWRKKVLATLILSISLIVSIGFTALSSKYNSNVASSFWGTISRSLNHLSLGVIKKFDNAKDDLLANQPSSNEKVWPAYSGYVAESTDIRTSLSQKALVVWRDGGYTRLVFGTGIGSSGVAMAGLNGGDSKQIVQNQYIAILLELGFIGLSIFLYIIIATFRLTVKEKWLWGIIVSYLMQWLFFNGLPNAIHIYLMIAILLALFSTSTSQNLPKSTK